ncbi:hypothetical protein AOQ84DRAFT_133996 [Glonium stellatum]|uniref:Uncharacterized protein n=1 Tax=Glonium stellatum TaxID=574774 RepID=A0A8E2FAG8_9PEZI|nr:hypothetical protein AOQ84DRAFT_133996 [Glonium stellatum]
MAKSGNLLTSLPLAAPTGGSANKEREVEPLAYLVLQQICAPISIACLYLASLPYARHRLSLGRPEAPSPAF